MSAFTPAQLREIAQLLRTQVPPLSDATARGQFPGFGSGQTDTYTAADNVDATHPLNIRYLIPQNFQRLTAVRLSFNLGPFRTYNSFTVSATGAGSSHSHSHNHASHSHSHNHGSHGHSQHLTTGSFAGAVTTDSGGTGMANSFGAATDVSNINGTTPSADATATTPTTDATTEASHTHLISGSSFLGVTEGATAAGVTIAFDGVDQTTALGGPWSVNVIELDVRAYVATASGAYHTIALQPNGLGRIEAHMRLSSYVDSRGNA